MRRNRIIWFCLWVLSIAGISLRGGAVTYGFFTAVTLVPVISILYLAAVYMLFHVYQELEQRYVSVNEPVQYRFSLVNEYPLQFVSIKVRFFSGFSTIKDLDDETEYELRPHTRIEQETRLICKYRGEYEIGIQEIEIQDFFRLFRIRYKNKECIHAVVKPQLIQTDAIGAAISEAVKESERSKSELDILSREYVPGDDPRFIHWNQSARTGTLMTRILTGSDHQEIAVITDTFRESYEPAVFLPAENKMLEIVLAVACYFSMNQIRTAEYHLGQEFMRFSTGSTWEFEEFYEMVSAISFSSLHTHSMLLESIMQKRDIFDSSMVFLVVSSWDASMETLLKELESNNLSAVIFFVSADEQGRPDLSLHKSCELICISPDQDLKKGLGT